MGSKKRKQLAATVRAIQGKWGAKALRKAEVTPTIPSIPTGFAKLDKALTGIGGIPRGRITEILGSPTSGMATLALKIMAKAQSEGDLVTYIDLDATFDPDYADRCGIEVKQLFLVRPHSGPEALEISRTLLEGRSTGLIVFDDVSNLLHTPANFEILAANLRQLLQTLTRSQAALIFLTPLHSGGALSQANYPSGLALPHYATLRLLLQRERWLHQQQDIRGYQAQVVVLKNKLGRAGQSARIAITFNGTVRGDST